MNILNRLPPVIAIVMLLALLGVWYLQLVPMLNQSESATKVQQTPESLTRQSAPEVKQRDLASFKLFGDPSAVAAEPEPVEEDLPETQLQLTLTGVLAGQNEMQTGALIEGPDRETLYYKIGDSLPGNATLHKVFADRIVVRRAGRLENLYFPESFSSGLTAFQDHRDQISVPVPATRPAVPSSVPGGGLSDARKRSIKERLSNLRKRIINSRN